MKWDRNELGRFLASIGAALLIAGYLRYSIQSELQPMSKVLLIAGAVILLGGMGVGFEGVLSFFSKRSSKLGTNTTVLTLGVLIILIIANVLGYQHHKRFDLTTQKLFTLSDQTKKTVGGLKSDVNIVRFSKTPDARFDDLMTEYRNQSSRVKFQNVDPQEKPDVAKDYGATHIGDVIVAAGSRKETIAPNAESPVSESDVTSAILKITRDKVKTVCFVSGHGEKGLADSQASGYSGVDQGLKKEGYSTKSVNLVTQSGVPSDCDVLVIAGPTQAYFPQEADMVKKYIDGGGKALLEIDPQTDPKLDDILQAWNINQGKNVVVDASGVGRMFGTGPAVPLVVDYGDSPITKNLKGGMTFFPLARTISIADKNKADVQDTELLKTSAQSFTIPNLEQKAVKFDPKTDQAGPLALGVAGDKKNGDKDSRIVVIGDSDFASNQWASLQHNGDLFFNTIDWLAQDEDLISIRPKEATDRHLTLTESQVAGLRWVDLIFVPGLVIFSGIFIWWKRR
jgi:gliding motility-associatede transport system auxiliary component